MAAATSGRRVLSLRRKLLLWLLLPQLIMWIAVATLAYRIALNYALKGIDQSLTQSVRSLPSTAPITQAAEEMKTAGVHRLLVVDDGKLVGIITSTDVARTVAEHGLRNVDRR